MTYTNAKYINDPFSDGPTGICCDINGVTSYVPLDPANSEYQRIMALVEAGELVIAPAAPPAPPQPVADLAFWQFMMAAWKLGFITLAEAEAAVTQRVMPESFAAAVAGLSEENQAEARIKWAGITGMVRTDPLFALIVAAGIATDEQIDGVFAVAATIT
jgi:hypothetical protein